MRTLHPRPGHEHVPGQPDTPTGKNEFDTMKTNERADSIKPQNQTLTPIFAAAVNRTDQWRELHALSRGWATAQGAQAEDLRAEAAKLLQTITRLEQCWAYPGPRLLTAIGEVIAQRDAATFARLVQKVSGALLSGDYRQIGRAHV